MVYSNRTNLVSRKLLTPKQRAKFYILAEKDMFRHGKFAAFSRDEIEDDLRLSMSERNEISGWKYVAKLVRTADLQAAYFYYQYTSLYNQLTVSIYRDKTKEKLPSNFELTELVSRHCRFSAHINLLLILHHLIDEVYDEHEDLESIELYEIMLDSLDISWFERSLSLEKNVQIRKLLLDESVSNSYDIIAKDIKPYGIYLMDDKTRNLAWLKDKLASFNEHIPT